MEIISFYLSWNVAVELCMLHTKAKTHFTHPLNTWVLFMVRSIRRPVTFITSLTKQHYSKVILTIIDDLKVEDLVYFRNSSNIDTDDWIDISKYYDKDGRYKI